MRSCNLALENEYEVVYTKDNSASKGAYFPNSWIDHGLITTGSSKLFEATPGDIASYGANLNEQVPGTGYGWGAIYWNMIGDRSIDRCLESELRGDGKD